MKCFLAMLVLVGLFLCACSAPEMARKPPVKYITEVLAEEGVRLTLGFSRGKLVYATATVRGRVYVSTVLTRTMAIFLAQGDERQALVCMLEEDHFKCLFHKLGQHQ